MLKEFIDLLCPRICQGCGGKIETATGNICNKCIKKIKIRLPPFCIRCGKQLHGLPEDILICTDCKKENPFFDRAHSVCVYEGVIKDLIHNFKYKKITCLRKDFVDLMIASMERYSIGKEAEFVVSIPMHPKKIFFREINHASILARDIARRLYLHHLPHILKKTKYTPQQSLLKRKERLKNVIGSFSVKKTGILKNRNILIVDDIFTTGSTVNECARVLKDIGVASVEVITLARGDISL